MGADRRLDEFAGLFVVGDVPEVGDGLPAGRADLGGDLLGGGGGRLAGAVPAGLPVVVDDDGRAEAGRFEGFGTPRPRPAPVTIADSPSSGGK